MTAVRITVTIHGGMADHARVKARDAFNLFGLLAEDLLDVGRNTHVAATDDEIERACALFVVGQPTSGRSVGFPGEMGSADALPNLAAETAHTYFSGLERIKRHALDGAELPAGFTIRVLERVGRKLKLLQPPQYEGMYVDYQTNGHSRVFSFDNDLRTAIAEKIALLRELRPKKSPPDVLHGFAVQGVMYELKDRSHADRRADLEFSLDPLDGRGDWHCTLPRILEPEKLKDLWRTRVEVSGVATFSKAHRHMAVERLEPLEPLDPVEAARRLRQRFEGIFGDLTTEQVMAEIRGND